MTNSQGEFLYISNRAELVLGSVPFIVPILRPEKSGRDEFVYWRPVSSRLEADTGAGQNLFAQLRGRGNDLIYYDWEITEQRLNHGRQFYDLASIMSTGGAIARDQYCVQALDFSDCTQAGQLRDGDHPDESSGTRAGSQVSRWLYGFRTGHAVGLDGFARLPAYVRNAGASAGCETGFSGRSYTNAPSAKTNDTIPAKAAAPAIQPQNRQHLRRE